MRHGIVAPSAAGRRAGTPEKTACRMALKSMKTSAFRATRHASSALMPYGGVSQDGGRATSGEN